MSKGFNLKPFAHNGEMMIVKQNGMYFVDGIKELVRDVGGEYNDFKDRPVAALIQSESDPTIYWAIPVGDLEHRDEKGLDRIQRFMNCPKSDIRHHYYHIGRTNKKSIFFISNVIPITPAYIDREYLVFDSNHYVIKNKQLIADLNTKLKRILSFEKSKIKQSNKHYFQQNIFGIYDVMLAENRLFTELHAGADEVDA
jgi:hypothetical protein